MENLNVLDLAMGGLALIIIISGLIMLLKGVQAFNNQEK